MTQINVNLLKNKLMPLERHSLQRRKLFHLAMTALGFGLSLGLTSCGQVNFSQPKVSEQNVIFNPNCEQKEVLLVDSFERQNVDDYNNSPFGWRRVVNDQGSFVGSTGDRINAQIYSSSQLGPAALQSSALYFYGRPGSSVHNIYIVSEPLPLGPYSEVGLKFSYLPIDLEAGEYINLEVCNGTPEEGGAGANMDINGLKSNKWAIVWSATGSLGQNRNGLNHSVSDWQSQKLVLSLKDYPSKDRAVFRFNIRVDEGFFSYNGDTPVLNQGMEDGVGLDDVEVAAVQCN